MTKTRLAGLSGDIVIFGCGTMAGAMLSRWIACGLPPERVTALRHSGAPVSSGVRVVADAGALPAQPAMLMIGVKPQVFGQVAPAINSLIGPDTCVVSIMAGLTIDDLTLALPAAAPGAIVRVMPNLPVADGRGIVATIGTVPPMLARLLAPLGSVHAMADEAGANLVTALTACGPAFVYRFVGALAGAAVRLGLEPADADVLARAMVACAAATLAQTDATPQTLADAVASPGGMTQAGLDVLDSDGRLVALLADTLRATRERGREIAAAARGD